MEEGKGKEMRKAVRLRTIRRDRDDLMQILKNGIAQNFVHAFRIVYVQTGEELASLLHEI